jgi:hypothetical protein
VRYGLPLVAAAICLIGASMVSSQIVAFVLIFVAFGFVMDVSTKLFENTGKTGGLGDHRQ